MTIPNPGSALSRKCICLCPSSGPMIALILPCSFLVLRPYHVKNYYSFRCVIANPVGSLVLTAMVWLSSCQSDDISFIYPIEREITSVEVTPTQVQEFSDSLVFSISYRDGDGDIGRPEGIRYPYI